MSHLQVTLDAPEEVEAGDRVAYAVVIRNSGSEPVDLHLQGREPTFDLRVADEAGATVWRRLEGQSVQAILRLDTLGPGEAMTLDDLWDQRDASGEPLPPGSYILQAEVLTDGEPLVSQARKLCVTTG
ncbi:MAG: BsuPI-related putative proteinase inhibitor [Gemmatimonadaceae bacterium]